MDPFEPLRALQWPASVVVLNEIDAVGTYGDPRDVYEWASVTKTVASFGILLAVDRGLVALGDEAGPNSITLRHLLSHSAGYPFEGRDPVAKPEVRRIYSNTGIELAAEYIESRMHVPFREWLRRSVLDPLGMDTANLYGSPAHEMRGSALDLAKFARALLLGALIRQDTLRDATSPVFPDLKGVLPGYGRQEPNTWGLGFEIRDHKRPHWTGHNNSPQTFGHFGQAGSFMWVDPRRNLATVFLGQRRFSLEHAEIWPDLSDRILAAYSPLR